MVLWAACRQACPLAPRSGNAAFGLDKPTHWYKSPPMAGNKSPSRAGLLLEYAAFFSPSQRPMSQDSNRLALSRRFSVAPMMDWTY